MIEVVAAAFSSMASLFFDSLELFFCSINSEFGLGFFCVSDSFPFLSIYQPLNTVNHCTPHFLCSHNALGFAGDVTLSLLTATLSRTITHKYVHTQINAYKQPTKRWIHPFLIPLLPCVINAFLFSLLLPPYADFSLSFPNHLFPKAQNGFNVYGVCG